MNKIHKDKGITDINKKKHFLVHTRTLPHPRHNNHIMDTRSRDDQMIGKGYMPSPSPAPPLDGSYYNMNSDRYLSYPPMVSFVLFSCY